MKVWWNALPYPITLSNYPYSLRTSYILFVCIFSFKSWINESQEIRYLLFYTCLKTWRVIPHWISGVEPQRENSDRWKSSNWRDFDQKRSNGFWVGIVHSVTHSSISQSLIVNEPICYRGRSSNRNLHYEELWELDFYLRLVRTRNSIHFLTLVWTTKLR
jgi:hypothetical protein